MLFSMQRFAWESDSIALNVLRDTADVYRGRTEQSFWVVSGHSNLPYYALLASVAAI